MAHRPFREISPLRSDSVLTSVEMTSEVVILLFLKRITVAISFFTTLNTGIAYSPARAPRPTRLRWLAVVISTEVRTKSERSGEIPDNRSITLQLLYFSSVGDLSATR